MIDTRPLVIALHHYPLVRPTWISYRAAVLLAADAASGGAGLAAKEIAAFLGERYASVRRVLAMMAHPAGQPLPQSRADRQPYGRRAKDPRGMGMLIRHRRGKEVRYTIVWDFTAWYWPALDALKTTQRLIQGLPPLAGAAVSNAAFQAARHLLGPSESYGSPRFERLAHACEQRLSQGMRPAVLLVIAKYAASHGYADALKDTEHPDRVFFEAVPQILAEWRADHVRRSHLL